MPKKAIAVFFGGRSGEHVVSLRSSEAIMEAIDREKYDLFPVGITREGAWIAGPDAWHSLWEMRAPRDAYPATMLFNPQQPGLLLRKGESPSEWHFQPLDVAFPVLHGTYGEDGTIQGLFEMAGLPYVGSGVLASSTGMDKVVMKALFREKGLPVGPYTYLYHWQWRGREEHFISECSDVTGYPCFVKPANLGSSVGISKVKSKDDLRSAVEEAFLYDDKVIVEAFIEGREIECSVLGDLDVRASRPGEIVPCNEFYDYKAKYIDDRSELIIPVTLPPEVEKSIKDLSVKAFQAVEASGLARVDFFLCPEDDRIVINEINTMPGFTSISMYPKLWEASGISFKELVSRLIDLAMARHKRRLSLQVSPPE